MRGTRRFIDAIGFHWQVCGIPQGVGEGSATLAIPADRGAIPVSLYFFSRGTTLVLREHRGDWESLSWEELDELRRTAEVLGSDSIVRLASADREVGAGSARAGR